MRVEPGTGEGYKLWLAAAALAYSVAHHLGSVPGGLGTAPRGTRWGDWIDLLIPCLVLAPAAQTLRRAGATERTWWLFGLGALAYTSGHGIHLASNSIGNTLLGTTPANLAAQETAHLWDEAVGHLLWYAGVAVVMAALAMTMTGRPRPAGAEGALAYVLALAVGLTWVTNVIGGEGTSIPGLVLALAATGFGWSRRGGLPVVLAAAGGVASIGLTAVLVAELF